MERINAFYFSGTGNTKYVTEGILKRLSKHYRTCLYDISTSQNFSALIKESDLILLAFPIYGSAPPIPMRRFIYQYEKLFHGKEVILTITQYFFSGDGAASLGRSLEKLGAHIIGAEHFNMPNNLSDCKIFPVKNGKELTSILSRAEKKMDRFAEQLLKGKKKKRGFSPFSHALGFFSQRVFWRKCEAEKRKRLKIDSSRCVGCGLCAKMCPAENLRLSEGKIIPKEQCVLCYRCVNACPRSAISLIGSSGPQIQYKGIP